MTWIKQQQITKPQESIKTTFLVDWSDIMQRIVPAVWSQLTITMSLKSAKSINGEAAKRRQAIRAESPDCNEITRLS